MRPRWNGGSTPPPAKASNVLAAAALSEAFQKAATELVDWAVTVI
jgi:hypothetical protein